MEELEQSLGKMIICIKNVRKPESYNRKRFIIVHVGTGDGFIDGASLIFLSKPSTGDYHGDMNYELFQQWTIGKLIPNLVPRVNM